MNKSEQTVKRLFFGFEALAPWPEKLPKGRMLDSGSRHMTLAFLGETQVEPLMEALSGFPKPPFAIGINGVFDKCLFLPERHPHVVAWHADFKGQYLLLNLYHQIVVDWLKSKGFPPKTHGKDLLPHVTICRSPFREKEWLKAFHPLPMMLSNLHLYESVGGLKYEPIWSLPIDAPFKEIDHTADIAFLIRGKTHAHLLENAQAALLHKFPELLPYLAEAKPVENLDDLIVELNTQIAKADSEIGIPLKAVSFHGKAKETGNRSLEWEMIVDV